MRSNKKLINGWNKLLPGLAAELLGAAVIIFLGWLIALAATGGRM